MNYLLAEKLSKSYGEKLLFENITFGIERGAKVALIAGNGCGKTTLLNILTGRDIPDEGKVTVRNDIRIAYLPQNPGFDDGVIVMDALFRSDNKYFEAIKQYEASLEALREDDSVLNRRLLDDATAVMDTMNAWDYENRIREVLNRFGIVQLNQKIGALSGGMKKKVAMASVLIDDADLVIMDEPTNHLDVTMIEWLEEHLAQSKCTLLLVTHDRYFLDNVCNEIIELDGGVTYHHRGDYAYFLQKKAERREFLVRETEKARNIYRTELDWMRRQPQARGTKAKARIDAFYGLEDKAKRNLNEDAMAFEVKMSRMGNKILELHGVTKAYGDNLLVKDFSFTFKKGERIGLVGRNGVGKSTLLNMITGKVTPDAGSVVAGETIKFGYFSQEGLKCADDKRVIDIVKEIAEVVPVGDGAMGVSQFLLRFNFPYDSQYNYFGNLSGGERRRLFLLMTLMQSPNFLILDEPTNDLDIDTLNVLEDYLVNYPGCLMIVSHDRHFLDKVVEHVFVFEGNGVVKDHYGNYTSYYHEKLKAESDARRKEKALRVKEEKPKEKPVKTRMSYKEKKEFESLEQTMAELEQEKTELITAMNSGEMDAAALEKAGIRFSAVEQALDEKEMRWLELSELEG